MVLDIKNDELVTKVSDKVPHHRNATHKGIMGKVRYAEKSKEVHPYKPWADKSDSAEPHFRAFKACQNCTEWTVYVLPVLWLYALYVPAIPVVGKFLPWSTSILGLPLHLRQLGPRRRDRCGFAAAVFFGC